MGYGCDYDTLSLAKFLKRRVEKRGRSEKRERTIYRNLTFAFRGEEEKDSIKRETKQKE